LTTQTVERLGLPGDAADKGVVQQARHCWAFSHAYSNKMLKGRAAAAAKEAWGFMTDHMLRADDATWCGQGAISSELCQLGTSRADLPRAGVPSCLGMRPPGQQAAEQKGRPGVKGHSSSLATCQHSNLQKDPSSTPI
jgi:hypothetical protein